LASFTLNRSDSGKELSTDSQAKALSSDIFIHNIYWFIKLRWLVVGILILAAIAGALFSGYISTLGFTLPVKCLLSLAGALTLANILFIAEGRKIHISASRGKIEQHLWQQILIDLTVLTVLVHYVGRYSSPGYPACTSQFFQVDFTLDALHWKH
jgi:hypothetical protein